MNPDEYNYIMRQDQRPKNNIFNSNSTKQRLIIVVIGALILIGALLIMYMLLFGSQKDSKEILLPVAASQEDIIDITEIGTKELRDASLLNATASTYVVIASQNAKTTSRIGEDASKLVEPLKNDEYQKVLDEAKASGTFDQAFKTLLSNRLDLYRQTIVTAYSESSSKEIKKELESFNSQVGLLLGEPTTPQ
jgi:hypothetical protein